MQDSKELFNTLCGYRLVHTLTGGQKIYQVFDGNLFHDEICSAYSVEQTVPGEYVSTNGTGGNFYLVVDFSRQDECDKEIIKEFVKENYDTYSRCLLHPKYAYDEKYNQWMPRAALHCKTSLDNEQLRRTI
jgi:hypothetical protein